MNTKNLFTKFGRYTLGCVGLLIVFMLAMFGAMVTGCATADRALYNYQTNYTPHVIVRTVTNEVTKEVPVVVERLRVIHVTNEVGQVSESRATVTETNLVTVTNVETRVVLHTNQVPQVVLTEKAEVKAAAGGLGSLIGSLFGAGGIGGIALTGAYGFYMRWRNRKAGDREGAYVQAIETMREIMKATPQGQKLDAEVVEWLKQHQKTAGIIGDVSKAVETFVDSRAAKLSAQEILALIQRAT